MNSCPGPIRTYSLRMNQQNMLVHASKFGCLESIRNALDSGADIDALNTGPPEAFVGVNALHAALTYGKADAVKLLLDRGADPHVIGGTGSVAFSAVAWAKINGDFKSLKLMVASSKFDGTKVTDRDLSCGCGGGNMAFEKIQAILEKL